MKWLLVLILVEVSIAQQDVIRLPAEWEPHERTFLCWPRTDEIWQPELLPEVRKDVAAIANAIAKFEKVVVFAVAEQVQEAEKLLDSGVEVVAMQVDDLWARDTVSVFVEKTIANGRTGLVAVLFNFNGWGNKQIHQNDAKLAEAMVQKYNIESVRAKVVAEGGSFETDGKGTLLVTESSIVNTNRNDASRDDIEAELKRVLGVRKVIWFKGVKGQDITDAHVDCLVRFVKPGTVVLNRSFPGSKPDHWSISADDAYNVLKSSTDADGNSFEIIDLYEPDPDKIIIKGEAKTFLTSYVNFLIGNKCVIVPKFGDPDADWKAQETLKKLFPDREVVPVQISALASGGGGIHCSTREQPQIKQEL